MKKPWAKIYTHVTGYSLRMKKGKSFRPYAVYSPSGELLRTNMGRERAGLELAHHVLGIPLRLLNTRHPVKNKEGEVVTHRVLWHLKLPEVRRWLATGERWVQPRYGAVGPRDPATGQLRRKPGRRVPC